MKAAGGGSRSQRAAERLAGDGREEPPAGNRRGEGTPEESPRLGPRLPSRPVWSSLGLSLVISLVPRGPAGCVTLHRQELGPGCRRLGPRIPPRQRLGFEVRAERTLAVSSFLSFRVLLHPSVTDRARLESLKP